MQPTTSQISGCLPRIRSVFSSLTKAEQKVAAYMLDNPAAVVHLSITELAEGAGSAEATIFRLCQKIGFKGYQAFKIALAGDLYTPMETVYEEVDSADSIALIAGKVFHSINEGLQDTLKLLNPQAVEEAVAALARAKRIDAYGSGGSAIIAADIEHRFMRFGVCVRAYGDSHMQIASAALLSPGDVVVAVSHTGSNRELLDSVATAKKSGTTVIALTSYMKSPLSELADISLVASARETKYRSEAMASRLAHLAIVDVLYIGVMLQNKERLVANMQKVREAIALRRL